MARKRAKGGNGSGGISKRKDGLYVGRVTVGWEVVDGQRKQLRKAVYGRTIADVQAKLIEVQAQHQQGALPAQRGRAKTVARFAAEWLAGAEKHVRPRSLLRYRELLDLHIVPALGQTPLTKLTVDQVNRLLAQKSKAGLSARTCNYMRGTLRTMLREAERQSLVSRNVAALARPLPETKTEPEVLTEEAARLVLEAAETDADGPLWVLGLTTGARASELLGLRWSDVDVDGARVVIRQTVQETPKALRAEHGRWLVQATKTEKSRRVIPLTGAAVAALRRQRHQQNEWRLAAGPAWQPGELVFTSPTGGPLAVTTVTHRWDRLSVKPNVGAETEDRVRELRDGGLTLAEIAARMLAENVSPGRGSRGWSATMVARVLGWPAVNFHAATRHSVATFLHAAKVPLKTISGFLGHSQLATTADVYTHLAEAEKREAADAIGRVLGG